MVADMSVGIAGLTELENEIKDISREKQVTNTYLGELVKLKKLELSEKKPDLMFLLDLSVFLKSLHRWDASDMMYFDTDTISDGKVGFVTPKFNGRIIKYRDDAGRCDMKEVEVGVNWLNVDYYIKKIDEILSDVTNI